MGDAIFRRRGDTYGEPVTITDKNGVPQDINGKAFVLTCSRVESPDDASAQLFQLVGNIVDGDNGQVEFPMTAEQADNVGNFFFDIEMSDAIPETFVWTVPSGNTDGDPVTLFTTEGPRLYGLNPQTLTYQTRDTRSVIRTHIVPVHAFDFTAIVMTGTEFPKAYFDMPGWEWRITGYIDKGLLNLQIIGPDGGYGSCRPYISTRGGVVDAEVDGSSTSAIDGASTGSNAPNLDTTGWPVAGWYQVGMRVLSDWSVEWLVKPEGDPDVWNDFFVGDSHLWNEWFTPILIPRGQLARDYPEDPASISEFWKFEWRKL